MDEIKILNTDCLTATQHLSDETVDLGIYDPPFGIGEGQFDRHYKRDSTHVIEGYQEAPDGYDAYYKWTLGWLAEAKRVLRPNGSMYVVMGHSNLRAVLNAAYALGLHEINHILWKYNFGVYTRKKYVTAHYHVIYYCKSANAQPTFNTHCRFSPQEKAYQGGSRLYQDLEDVFVIPKDNKPGKDKNQNKLPDALIQKMIQYSSKQGDVVCDFFMGNFTTAYVARRLGRKVCGFEINPNTYGLHLPQIEALSMGCDLHLLPTVVDDNPARQGQPITDSELENIADRYNSLFQQRLLKREIREILQEEQQRGHFSIINIIERLHADGKLDESLAVETASDSFLDLFEK